MSDFSQDWNPRRQKQAKKMLELRRQRSEAWQESTEFEERALQSYTMAFRYVPWLVGFSAVVAAIAAITVLYRISAGLISGS